MSDPYLGDMSLVGFTFAPRGWANCEGQILPINQNQSLYALLGTTYGGDGRTTFALPDLRGRAAIHTGQGPGLSNRNQGSRGGSESNTLVTANLPSHTHPLAFNANEQTADQTSPDGNVFAEPAAEIFSDQAGTVKTRPNETLNAGGGQSVDNMQPFLALRFIIAVQGVFPSRN